MSLLHVLDAQNNPRPASASEYKEFLNQKKGLLGLRKFELFDGSKLFVTTLFLGFPMTSKDVTNWFSSSVICDFKTEVAFQIFRSIQVRITNRHRDFASLLFEQIGFQELSVRYKTFKEAQAGHLKVVEAVEATLIGFN